MRLHVYTGGCITQEIDGDADSLDAVCGCGGTVQYQRIGRSADVQEWIDLNNGAVLVIGLEDGIVFKAGDGGVKCAIGLSPCRAPRDRQPAPVGVLAGRLPAIDYVLQLLAPIWGLRERRGRIGFRYLAPSDVTRACSGRRIVSG